MPLRVDFGQKNSGSEKALTSVIVKEVQESPGLNLSLSFSTLISIHFLKTPAEKFSHF